MKTTNIPGFTAEATLNGQQALSDRYAPFRQSSSSRTIENDLRFQSW